MLCLYYISPTLHELHTIVKMKLKLKSFEKFFKKNSIHRSEVYYNDLKLTIIPKIEKGPSFDGPYIILIQN